MIRLKNRSGNEIRALNWQSALNHFQTGVQAAGLFSGSTANTVLEQNIASRKANANAVAVKLATILVQRKLIRADDSSDYACPFVLFFFVTFVPLLGFGSSSHSALRTDNVSY